MAKRTDKGSSHRAPVPSTPPDTPPTSPSPLSSSDLKALESFCKAFDAHEVDLSSWKDTHKCLDLTVFAYVSQKAIDHEETVEVAFSRTVCVKTEDVSQTKREKARHSFQLSKEHSHGDAVTVTGAGDQKGKRSGDLRIIIKIRNDC